ncbi:UDP-glucosyltransferase 2-like [Leptopilina heterotoma]|uniref:UDP-glucosyltransferase 2-like n=1 Tax=Leptopilina heterotoma TaxID=63436 RepID=UPI001CA88CC2|nr:UDP-glucosyltransferase 2-like [Leptopilina heterotoma]
MVKKKKLRILAVFHHPGKSHFQVFKPLLEKLALRGHELTVVSHFPKNMNNTNIPFENYKDIDLLGPTWTEVIDLSEIDYSIFRAVNDAIVLRHWALRHCQKALNVPGVQQLIQSDSKFDLIITELFNSDCFLGFVHKFQAPFVALTSHEIVPWANERFGNPDNPSYIPNTLMTYKSKMTFIERTVNTFFLWFLKNYYHLFWQNDIDKIVKETFGHDTPHLLEIAKKTSAMLINSHYSLFGARPYNPNIIEIGGIHIRKVKALPGDLKKFLDNASEGVIVFSWGSMIKSSTLPEKKLKALFKVFSEIPRKVVWKWEGNEHPELPKNVMIKKWIPQFDLLSE